ncbi:CS1-pili formation C-terminal domain-containing protein [Serratia sp. UGAL515B_01]|uniref:CS1-pili formation C-terminal domain-containing protein n=1 Tax=Serratia sp. UGAL515B_01 TaxID=2986763 RepID=UPI00295487D3|nr:CS1-pili formation C-terminal domain-containing protein [Serratia sp. UGAL515B_01]WON76151.1 CS1-pili formation C-terminal domain-containing protein [Serratia sp. UGAL515B_01]
MGNNFTIRTKTVALCITAGIVAMQADARNLQDARLGNYLIPGIFGQALAEGMSIPVFLRYKGGDQQEKQKVADAQVVLEKGSLMIKDITLVDNPNGATLTENTRTLISSVKDSFFSQNTRITLSPDAELNLDLRSFVLTLDVSEKSLSPTILSRQSVLGESSVQNFSSVLNYDLGVYRTQVKQGNNASNSYLNLDNTFGIAEHHFNVNGAFYGIGDSQQTQLYRAMYERDMDGYRLALGLVDTWNLQSLGSLSALNTSKVYGVTYGNKSSTKIRHNQYSLTPITVFLPDAGEVHVYRQGRLLNIQNFPMGSFEVDTSRLPFGIYDVDVEVVIDGKVHSRMRQTINKSFSGNNIEVNQKSWQLYGGYVHYDNRSRRTNTTTQTYLAGGAAAISIPEIFKATSVPAIFGLVVQTSSYIFDNNVVNETSANLSVNQFATLGWQGLISQGGRYRNIFSISTSLPDGYGSLWANREKSHIGDSLPVYESDAYSYGSTFSLSRFFERGGQITLSRMVDKRDRSISNNLEYSTALFSGRLGSVNLRAGIQRYRYDNQSSSSQRYVSLDFSLPLAAWLSTGVSSSNGNVRANLAANKSFDNSPLTSAGFNLAKLVKDKHNGESDYSASGYAAFDTKYSAGTLSLSRPDSNRLNGNLTARGSVAYSDKHLAASGIQERSGVIVKTDIMDNAVLSAQVNGRSYRLTGSDSFIPLPPYASYKVELMNHKNTMDSFDIVKGRISNVTLYPGNVAVYKPEVKQLVTVFGRMTTESGRALANAAVRNHIGKTTTDATGAFSMDVDKRFPSVSLTTEDYGICEVDLDLNQARGVKWVGDVVCAMQTILAQG